MKTRETAQEERYEIVKACIDSGLDYGATAEKYKVSYQQVYTWVRKYKELGKPGLEDRRGQRKKIRRRAARRKRWKHGLPSWKRRTAC